MASKSNDCLKDIQTAMRSTDQFDKFCEIMGREEIGKKISFIFISDYRKGRTELKKDKSKVGKLQSVLTSVTGYQPAEIEGINESNSVSLKGSVKSIMDAFSNKDADGIKNSISDVLTAVNGDSSNSFSGIKACLSDMKKNVARLGNNDTSKLARTKSKKDLRADDEYDGEMDFSAAGSGDGESNNGDEVKSEEARDHIDKLLNVLVQSYKTSGENASSTDKWKSLTGHASALVKCINNLQDVTGLFTSPDKKFLPGIIDDSEKLVSNDILSEGEIFSIAANRLIFKPLKGIIDNKTYKTDNDVKNAVKSGFPSKFSGWGKIVDSRNTWGMGKFLSLDFKIDSNIESIFYKAGQKVEDILEKLNEIRGDKTVQLKIKKDYKVGGKDDLYKIVGDNIEKFTEEGKDSKKSKVAKKDKKAGKERKKEFKPLMISKKEPLTLASEAQYTNMGKYIRFITVNIATLKECAPKFLDQKANAVFDDIK